MKDFTFAGWRSPLHRTAVLIFFVIIFLSYVNPVFLSSGFILFAVAASIRLRWRMVLFLLAAGLLLAAAPFVIPFVYILMVVLFLVRVGYVLQNWRPILAGLVIYGMAIPLYLWTSELHLWGQPLRFGEPLVVAMVGGTLLHLLLMWQYRHGYTSLRTLELMGSAPVILITVALPFLKPHIGYELDGIDKNDGTAAGAGKGSDANFPIGNGNHVEGTYPNAKSLYHEALYGMKAHDRPHPEGVSTILSIYPGDAPNIPAQAAPLLPDDRDARGLELSVQYIAEGPAKVNLSGGKPKFWQDNAQEGSRSGPILAAGLMVVLLAGLVGSVVQFKLIHQAAMRDASRVQTSGRETISSVRYWFVTSFQANIREAPHADAPILHVEDQGARLKFLHEQSEDENGRIWYKIEIESKMATGWISSKIVQDQPLKQ